MDVFNLVWCALWSDLFMVQHQYDMENDVFNVPTEIASDFLFFLSEVLQLEKKGYHLYDDEDTVSVKLSTDEIDTLTDWISNFNHSLRSQSSLPMPDFYLDEENIRPTTVNAYCQRISEFIAYILKNQSIGREKIGGWAMENFVAIYSKAYSDALLGKTGR